MLNASISVIHGPPIRVPPLPGRPSSIETSATARMATIASVVELVTLAIAGRSAARGAGPAGCSQAKTPAAIRAAPPGASRNGSLPRSSSVTASRASRQR